MLTKKEQCKSLMLQLFGPASAKSVDNMTEAECVVKCRQKAQAMLGEEKAKNFDSIK